MLDDNRIISPQTIDNETGEIVRDKDRTYYATNLNGLYSQAAHLSIDSGNMLIEAKANLDHGEFEAMIKSDLYYGPRTAQMLMSLANHPVISNANHGSHLPQSWRTLYELTKIPELEEKIRSGEVNPNTTRREAKAMHAPAHVSRATGENEWYTPPEYIEAARRVMGGIDLDPASSDIANQTVKAETYYTIDNDGLSYTWHGRVWMNPPYAQPLIAQFCDKLMGEMLSGNVNQAITLTNNATETKWLSPMLSTCSAACFPVGRIKFIDKDGNPNGAPLQGQIILYFGHNIDRFIREFSKFGPVK